MRHDSRNGTHGRISLDPRSASARHRTILVRTVDARPDSRVDVAAPSDRDSCLGALFYVWRGAMPDFTTSAYFSAVTYTTAGYGDLVLPKEWRLVGGVEALTGILMCGLSTGLFFAVFTDVFGINRRSSA